MRNCMVPFCKNSGRKPGVRYFMLTNYRRDPWLRALGRLDTEISAHSTVCSEHFMEEDFVVKAGKKRLRKEAVPVLKLRPSQIKRELTKKQLTKKDASVVFNVPSKNREILQELAGRTSLHSKSAIFLPSTHQVILTTESELVSLESKPTIVDIGSIFQVPSTSQVKQELIGLHSNPTAAMVDNKSASKSTSYEDFWTNKGVRGSLQKLRMLVKLMHNYSKPPRNLSTPISALREKNKKLHESLRKEKARVTQLKKKVCHLRGVIKKLKNVGPVSANTREKLQSLRRRS